MLDFVFLNLKITMWVVLIALPVLITYYVGTICTRCNVRKWKSTRGKVTVTACPKCGALNTTYGGK